jgi:uncharacterized protein
MRGVPRWSAVVAVLAIATAVCAFTVRRTLAPPALRLQLSENVLPADGFASSDLSIHSSNGRELHGLQVQVETPHQATIESLSIEGSLATASVRAGVLPGETKLRITAPGFAPQELALRMTSDSGDAVGDGTPDFLRLHDPADRLAFRRWFTLLAESQYYRGNSLPSEIDDCAALLRFAYREALRQHDANWAHAMALPAPASAGDIQQYQYPYTPLGADIFRVRGGGFQENDLRDGAFAEFADAGTLWRHNTFSVGRSLERARPGDLLFFRQDSGRMPFHAMIFLGRSQVEPDSQQFVVYHTGPNGRLPGEIKRLSVAQLLNYPDARWRPIASNPAFLGVYRWNILRGGE